MKDAKNCWNSKFGLILAASGSAIGLGNLWRFPYLAAKNGGGTFLFFYLFFAIILGQTLLITETALGIKSQQGPLKAFSWLHPKLKFMGLFSVLIATFLLPYYSVIGGWILLYLSKSFLFHSDTNFQDYFNNFISSDYPPLIALFIFILMTLLILNKGIRNGIESFCKYAIPFLLIFLFILIYKVMNLPNAFEGVKYFFIPDFSKITSQTCLDAIGQVFFSISVGAGVYITYGSYLKQNDNISIGKTMWPVVSFDTIVSLLTGFAIFPAVFSFGIEMNSGPTLVFITFPKIFSTISYGNFFAFIFFCIFLLSALTSSISMAEVLLSYITDKFNVSRKKTICFMFIYYFIIGGLASLSFGRLSGFKIANKNIFEQMDFLCSNVFMPLCGFLTCIFVGWIADFKQFQIFKNPLAQKGYEICLKWILPFIMIVLIIDCITQG